MPVAGISLYFLLFLFLFAFGCLKVNPAINHYSEVTSLLKKGDKFLAQDRYNDAIASYKKALIHSRNLPHEADLIQKIKSRIKKTKAKSLVDHYQSIQEDNHSEKNRVLPATFETNEFKVLQSFGEIHLSRIWSSKKITELDGYIGMGRKVTLQQDSGLEIQSSLFSLRTIGPAGFSLDSNASVFITSGIYFISGGFNTRPPLFIEFPIGKNSIKSQGLFAFFLEITTNGGCKLIGLVGEPYLALQNQKIQLKPGELIFVMSDGFSRKMNIELSTFIATSHLMADFQEPPIFSSKMRQNALIQAIRTKRHFRAMVGDAKNERDFEIKILEDDQSKE
jgi:hypothetical protein